MSSSVDLRSASEHSQPSEQRERLLSQTLDCLGCFKDNPTVSSKQLAGLLATDDEPGTLRFMERMIDLGLVSQSESCWKITRVGEIVLKAIAQR